jgi:hypothetical protein
VVAISITHKSQKGPYMPYTEVSDPFKPLLNDSATSDQINQNSDRVRKGENPCQFVVAVFTFRLKSVKN